MREYITDKALREANKKFRERDESHLYPINGAFNATERAIRRLRKYRTEYPMSAYEYLTAMEHEISKIVNGYRG